MATATRREDEPRRHRRILRGPPDAIALKLATWNVNSLNVRLPRVLTWLGDARPDVLCLQETKLEDAKFPRHDFAAAGYGAHYVGQRTYNGVALLVREGVGPVEDIVTALPDFADEQKRVLAATVGGIRVIDFYVPNGQSVDSDKYRYKLDWCRAATAFIKGELARHPALAVAGDFNIAPEDRDVHDPELWRGQVLCSEPERSVFRGWLGLGLKDSFRLFDQPEKAFSWWDYRQLAFPKNHGLRIDHILLSPALSARCAACRIDRNARKGERPSDHAPVIAEIAA
jgi:exodeoxyribonuclease-3